MPKRMVDGVMMANNGFIPTKCKMLLDPIWVVCRVMALDGGVLDIRGLAKA
jgi:hypothetical protein